MVFDKVKEVIAEQLELDADSITMESSLLDDLKANSVDVVGVVMALEEEYDIEFPYDDIDSISTVGDAVRYIESQL
ncbi:MAG: acyl carrier protein [Eubacteriales bacterium]